MDAMSPIRRSASNSELIVCVNTFLRKIDAELEALYNAQDGIINSDEFESKELFKLALRKNFNARTDVLNRKGGAMAMRDCIFGALNIKE